MAYSLCLTDQSCFRYSNRYVGFAQRQTSLKHNGLALRRWRDGGSVGRPCPISWPNNRALMMRWD
jgi:hypothetical protein